MKYISPTRTRLRARQIARRALNKTRHTRIKSGSDLDSIKERLVALQNDRRNRLITIHDEVNNAHEWLGEMMQVYNDLEKVESTPESERLKDVLWELLQNADYAFGAYQLPSHMDKASDAYHHLSALLDTVGF